GHDAERPHRRDERRRGGRGRRAEGQGPDGRRHLGAVVSPPADRRHVPPVRPSPDRRQGSAVSTASGQSIFADSAVGVPKKASLAQRIWDRRFDYLYVLPALVVML